MTEQLPIASLMGFLLALVRTTSWMAVSPPFNSKAVPRLVKLGTAAGLALAISSRMPTEDLTLETGPLLGLVLMQVATGLVLGFLTQVLFSAVAGAGSLIDLFGGFTMSQAMDPFSNNQSSIFGRFYGMMGTVLLFATNGHLLLIKGFMTTFDVVPLGGIHLESFKKLLVQDIGMLMVAAVEIAGPLLAVYFLADVALGLLTKAAPQLNILTFGFPFKILITLLVVASALPLVPGALHTLLNDILRDGVHALHATTSAAAGGGGG